MLCGPSTLPVTVMPRAVMVPLSELEIVTLARGETWAVTRETAPAPRQTGSGSHARGTSDGQRDAGAERRSDSRLMKVEATGAVGTGWMMPGAETTVRRRIPSRGPAANRRRPDAPGHMSAGVTFKTNRRNERDMDGRPGARPDSRGEARHALEDALDAYIKGSADLESAARRAGMETFDFLKEAGSMPDPVAVEGGNDLPTFVRQRPGDER